MNSVTPIISLAASANETLTFDKGKMPSLLLSSNDADDFTRSLRAIESRSKGLVDFIHAYRGLANLTKPNMAEISVAVLFERVTALFGHELEKTNTNFVIDFDKKNSTICADSQQIEQVLINLVINAKESISGKTQGLIKLSCLDSGEQIKITVQDNGAGINKDDMQKIFIPFFSTKPQGSGIGLSLSKQIMYANKASLSAKSEFGQGAQFTLTFQKYHS